MAEIALIATLTVLVYMSLAWVLAIIRKRNDLADVAWGLGFVAITSVLMVHTGNMSTKHIMGLILIALWGVRLAVHIGTRHQGKPEDGRYQNMSKKWKHPALQSYTSVFLAQGFFMLLVATPIILLFNDISPEFIWVNYIGLVIWLIGFIFESVGDLQLKNFINSPKNKGKIMRYGLWRYTRHPNYFGEISQWWGFYLFTLFTPFWYLGIIGPISITFLILGVSGIPMLEKRYKGNKEYEDYQKTTSPFIPLPPKN